LALPLPLPLPFALLSTTARRITKPRREASICFFLAATRPIMSAYGNAVVVVDQDDDDDDVHDLPYPSWRWLRWWSTLLLVFVFVVFVFVFHFSS
jgi:hypothetical protein